MKPEIKKLLILNAPYLLFVWLFDKVGAAVRLSPGADASAKLLHLGDGFTAAFSSAAPSFHPADLALGIAGAVIVRLIIYVKGKNAKKYRKGMEYGSARWGTAEDIKPYTDPVFENNIPLTQTERLTMNSRPKQPKYARNKNILVIGGSGSGKTRFFVKPSLMQMHSSYVVTDPKGTVLIECGKLLQRGGYRIKVLNTINFKKSMKYNPFAYLRSEKDILKLVNTIIANTKGDGEKSGEDFWVKAEKLYYTALIGYIWYEAPDEEKNFTTLLEMINASEAREDDEDFQNPVDLMFERLEEKDPEHFAVKQYKKYKLAAGKTAKSILISCGARLAPFDIKELRELMETDEMELDTIGDRKTALFVIISDTDDTFNFVVSILYTQLFNLLCDKADDVYGGRLPVHVRCLLDEFANIGYGGRVAFEGTVDRVFDGGATHGAGREKVGDDERTLVRPYAVLVGFGEERRVGSGRSACGMSAGRRLEFRSGEQSSLGGEHAQALFLQGLDVEVAEGLRLDSPVFGLGRAGELVESFAGLFEQVDALLQLLRLGVMLLQLLLLLFGDVIHSLGEDGLCRLLLGGEIIHEVHGTPFG